MEDMDMDFTSERDLLMLSLLPQLIQKLILIFSMEDIVAIMDIHMLDMDMDTTSERDLLMLSLLPLLIPKLILIFSMEDTMVMGLDTMDMEDTHMPLENRHDFINLPNFFLP